MHKKPLESDWKIFRKRTPEWRERYISKKNEKLKAILADNDQTATHRFWDLKKILDKEAKVLVDCLDGHSRTRMYMFLILMYRKGLINKSDLIEFSEELRESILAVVR